MAKKYIVTLTDDERESLTQVLHQGKGAARKLTRARILLKADAAAGQAAWKDERIVEALDVSVATVDRRIGQFDVFEKEVAAWQADRNACKAKVNWRFTTADARIKLVRLYPLLVA
jgi:hypothetical protein